MAKSVFPKKTLGIALIVVGAGLVLWGAQKSEGLESKLSSAITGSYTDNVMVLFIGGAVCLALGAYLTFK